MWRWTPVEGNPLLFVEVVWYDEERPKLAVFAADAIVQELPVPKILSFNCRKGEWMRMREFGSRDWRLDRNHGAFLNAWRAGSEDFVLTYLPGYEGYSVELQKLDFAKGLIPVIGFGE